ncbi:YbaB/EbfC family nucleoid-associated protein [Mycobacterium sp. WMMD1722]|uniref:YbaB/EbfC family nucleoid-associated protein n=1 Tax=Mycobacterium sp. WMMD1722 TaxID=3404117 RepID=UPI003BF5A5D3
MASSGPPADRDRFDRTVARAHAAASVCAGAVEALAAVRGSAASSDGAVTAVVDATGALVSLTLSDSVTRLSAATIGALVVETTQVARRVALTRREAVLGDILTDLDR